MKKTSWIRLLLLTVLCLSLTVDGYAQVSNQEYSKDFREISVHRVSGNVCVRLKSGKYQMYTPDLSTPLSETYDMIYLYSHADDFVKVIKGSSVGLLKGDGTVLVPAKYGDVAYISDRWQVGIALKHSTSDNYDYSNSSTSSTKSYYLVDHVDVFYRGNLAGALTRMEWRDATAFGDYLRVEDREKNFFFYTRDLQKMDRLELITKKKEEQTARSEYYNDYQTGFWHQGSGQRAFVPECTLQPDEVATRYTYRDGAVVDLQGNVVCRPVDCEPTLLTNVHGNLIKVRNSARKLGYIDLTGKQVVPCIYDELEDELVSAEAIGYAYAVRDDKAGFVNVRTGEETGFEYSSKLCKHYQGYYTITDLDGSLIVFTAAVGRLPDKFAEISVPHTYTHASNPLAVVKDASGRIGVLNMRGEWVVPLDAGYEGRDTLETSYDGTVITVYRSIERAYSTLIVEHQAFGGEEDMGLPAIEVPSFEDVFVPADPIPEVTKAPLLLEQGVENASWTCENGHVGNTGKFCSECGAPKPTPTPEPTQTPTPTPEPVLDGTWTCVNGHAGNTGKFCTECGAPKPVEEDGAWTCENGHSGNMGKFCSECGAPKPDTAPKEAQPQVPEGAQIEYDNPFPAQIARFSVPFSGTYYDHIVALNEFISHASPGDEHYLTLQKSGAASDNLAWDLYGNDAVHMYLIYRRDTLDVYAYAYYTDVSVSRRADWAAGSLMPNPTVAVGSVLWVESGEDNAAYSLLLETGSDTTDYAAVKAMLRNPNTETPAKWFNHVLSVLQQNLDGQTDRYWVVYHNTAD